MSCSLLRFFSLFCSFLSVCVQLCSELNCLIFSVVVSIHCYELLSSVLVSFTLDHYICFIRMFLYHLCCYCCEELQRLFSVI
jgi:hypothetical protein